MTKKIYVVHDCKSESYTAPMLHLAIGDALRAFTSAANNRETMIGTNPEDFSLFEVGEYDERTAKFKIWKSMVHVANAIDLVQSTKLGDVA